jgi:hypothetical protein
LLDVSCASYVGDENQHEEGVSVDGEAYSPRFDAGYSANPSKEKKNPMRTWSSNSTGALYSKF